MPPHYTRAGGWESHTPSERKSSDVTASVETFCRALAPDCAEALSAILELTSDKRMGQVPCLRHRTYMTRALAQRDLSSHTSHMQMQCTPMHSPAKERGKEVDAPHLLQRDVLKDLNVLLLRESNFKHAGLDAQPHGAVAGTRLAAAAVADADQGTAEEAQ